MLRLAPSKLAIVCSAHGFGHTARQLALAPELVRRGHRVVLYTAAPRPFWSEAAMNGGFEVRSLVVDVGIQQRDSLHEDPEATRARAEACSSEAALERLIGVLGGLNAEDRPDGVIVDVAPAALEAARRLGVPAVAVGNFDWAWIYQHYPPLAELSTRFFAWQAPHPGVDLSPGPGLHGFARVVPGGLLGRAAAPVRVVGPGERGVLVCFGGFGLHDLEARLPRVPGVRYVLAPPLSPIDRDDIFWCEHVPFPSLVAGADLVYTKPGYGILVEAMLAGTPILWEDRGAFPEAPSLVSVLRARGDLPAAPDRAAAILTRLAAPRPEPVRPPDLPGLAATIEALLQR